MKKKFKLILIGLISLFALTIPGKINAASDDYTPSSNSVTETQAVYTLPPQPVGEAPKGSGQDRQALGYIMKPGSTITLTNNSNLTLTVQLLNNNSAATINKKIPAHSTITITAPNPAVPQTSSNGKKIDDNANDVDLVPFILTPRTNDTSAKVSCNVEIQGPHSKLPVFSYTNDNQSTFMNEWKQSGSYALVEGKDFQIMLPADGQSYVENMDKAPMGMNSQGQPNPVPEGQKYVCHNLMDVLHFYDDVLYPTYDKIAGLSTDAKEPYNRLVPGKYFYTADIKGAGGANYGNARTEVSSAVDTNWLQPSWELFHETGHGYQTRELGGKEADQHVGEVSNNVWGNYMYYYILFNGNTKLADQYSWNYEGMGWSNKEKMETQIHDILVNDNWSWNQTVPNFGGKGKHAGLILLQNMVEKMTYAGWTNVVEMDRQQVYEATQNKETDLNSKLMNIWDLITKAASNQGYDYTTIMTEIGKTPELPLSQAARQKQDKVVNFLWYLMPKASYSEVYSVVQELAKADPNLVYDSNFTLVTPDQTKALNLNGKLNLTIYDLPSSWAGKTINIMNGNQVYGTLTIGPDGKCSLNNVPLGTYTLSGLPDNNHTLTNYYVTVTDDPAYMNSTDVILNSESSSSSHSSSSGKSSLNSSSKKVVSSSKESSSLNSSSKKVASSSKKSSSLNSSSKKVASSSKQSSSLKSSSKKVASSSKKSSSLKSSSKKVASSSKKLSSLNSSSKKSSSLNSSSKKVVSSSKKSLSLNISSKKTVSSSKKSSSLNSSSKKVASSSKESSSLNSSSKKVVSSSKKSSSLKSSSKKIASSSKESTSLKSSSAIKSSNTKSTTGRSHRVVIRSVKSSNAVKGSSSAKSSSIVSQSSSLNSSSKKAISSSKQSSSPIKHSSMKIVSNSQLSSIAKRSSVNAAKTSISKENSEEVSEEPLVKSSEVDLSSVQNGKNDEQINGNNDSKETTVISSKVINVSSNKNIPVTVNSTKEVPVPVKNGSSISSSIKNESIPVTSMTSTTVIYSKVIGVPVKSELLVSHKENQNPGNGTPTYHSHSAEDSARKATRQSEENSQVIKKQQNLMDIKTTAKSMEQSSSSSKKYAPSFTNKRSEKQLPQTGEAVSLFEVVIGIMTIALGYNLLKKFK